MNFEDKGYNKRTMNNQGDYGDDKTPRIRTNKQHLNHQAVANVNRDGETPPPEDRLNKFYRYIERDVYIYIYIYIYVYVYIYIYIYIYMYVSVCVYI